MHCAAATCDRWPVGGSSFCSYYEHPRLGNAQVDRENRRMQATIRCGLPLLLIFAAPLVAQDSSPAKPLTAEQLRQWRSQIRSALFVPDPLPLLEAQTHGRFEPVPDVVAERVTYRTQFGLRVPAIVYLPKSHSGRLPGLIVVNGHGGDKYSWYAFYSGVLYARAGAAV